MSSHAQCRHRATPEARRACRMVRTTLAMAARRGLVITEVTETERGDYVIPQYVISTQRNRDWDTRLLITAGHNTPRLAVRRATGHWEDEPWRGGRSARVWCDMMQEDDQRERA